MARLEEASARVAALTARAGAAVRPPTDPDLGTAVAARALRVTGDVRLAGQAVVLVPRAAVSYAAGRAGSALVDRLRSTRPGWPVHDVRGPDEARAAVLGAGLDAGGEVLLVVEGRPDPSYAAVVAAVLGDPPGGRRRVRRPADAPRRRRTHRAHPRHRSRDRGSHPRPVAGGAR